MRGHSPSRSTHCPTSGCVWPLQVEMANQRRDAAAFDEVRVFSLNPG